MNRTIWINSTLPDACDIFSRNLRYLLHHVNPHKMPLAFACIGSANVCGDNLGPLIGTILTRHSLPNVYGTMAEPLNALTLPDYMPLLKAIEKSCCLVAVDAAIGNKAQCGYLTLTKGTLSPVQHCAENCRPWALFTSPASSNILMIMTAENSCPFSADKSPLL